MNIWTRSKGRLLAALLLFWGVPARADDASEQQPPQQVVVRGPGSNAAGFTGKASLDDQPREIADVADLLEPIAGVHVRRQGGEDSFATLSIRGTSSSEVAVILAGVPLTGGADPALDLASLPLWPGARVRVFRSFAPATLGPGSLGGTLALDPPSPHDPERTYVWMGAGSFGAARLRVGDVRALPGGGRIALGLSASRATDDFSYYDPIAGQEGFRPQTNAQHASGQALAAYALPFTFGHRDGEISVTTLVQARRQHLPGTVIFLTPSQELSSDRELASVQMSLTAGPGAVYARLWGRREGLRLTNDPANAALEHAASLENDSIAATGGAIGWRGAPMKDVHLDIEADASGERFLPGDLEGPTSPPPGATRASIGAGADASWNVTPRWTIAASARADAWNDAATSTPDHAELHPTGHVGTEITFGHLSLASHGGALARPPSFLERYGDRGTFLGNPLLQTESAWTIDAGARLAGATKSRALSGQLEISGFATWAGDLITFVAEGAYGRERATNIGRARMIGLEIAANATAGPFFARLAYTQMSTANLAQCTRDGDGDTCDRPPLPGRPETDLVSDVGAIVGPVRLRYGVDVTSGQYADDVAAVRVPARVLQSTGAALDVPGVRGLRVTVDVRNLFDVRIATYPGAFGPVKEPIGDAYLYPLPGRTVFASLRYDQAR